MNVQVLGCSHQTAPLAVRERLAFGPEQARAALRKMKSVFPHVEAVLLSTCNRVELYAATLCGRALQRHQIAKFLADCHRLDPDDIVDNLYDWQGRDSVRHLFLVASSLDSMVVGEAQISSQVKQAYQLADQQEATGPLTHAAFQAAARAARRVAKETAVHERRVSVPSVAVTEFVGQIFERLHDKRALVVGAGEMAEETLRYLHKEGMRDFTIVNRHTHRAEEVAQRWQGCTAAWEQRYHEITRADLVVSATGADRPVIERVDFEQVMRHRGNRPLVILDLAVPRDCDPAIGRRTGVFLFSVDDLRAACEQNRRQRENELPKALRIVDEETDRFMGDWNFREVAPVIRQLQHSWEQRKRDELQRLLNKLPELDDRTRTEIARSFDRLTKKMLHRPVESLRREATKGVPTALTNSLARLFRFSH